MILLKGTQILYSAKMHPSRTYERVFGFTLPIIFMLASVLSHPHDNQPLSKISVFQSSLAFDGSYHIKATPDVLGVKGESTQWVTITFETSLPAETDWIAVYSPAKFNGSVCPKESEPQKDRSPILCTAPIKFQYANYSSPNYTKTGKGSIKLQLINQRADFAFAFYTGGLTNPVMKAISDPISFENPKAPLYPRLALTKEWNEMTVTWTSGYNIDEAVPLVLWGSRKNDLRSISPAGTLTYGRESMCGSPARTYGWRDPGFIHTSFLKDLWPNSRYFYKVGHRLRNGSYVWGSLYSFNSSPYPGQDSLQRVIVFGDMGKAERDGSNEYSNYQPGSLNTTDRLVEDIDNIDLVMLNGDMAYANGYISQWDQFTAQVEPFAARVPLMISSGNHERDWPDSGSFYHYTDSGGECGVPTQTSFYIPTKNRENFWYEFDYGMFHFCVADSEHDWRIGTEQHKFIEQCFANVDRQKQPWLIFLAHRVLGYSSNAWYGTEGSFEEPMGRAHLQDLWQKYKVDLAFFGHVHNYERMCPIYENQCVSSETSHYSGRFNATIHVVAGGGGSHLSDFVSLKTSWSVFKDLDFGFVKLTAFNHSTLLFEYKKSSDGKVYDQFTITRDYRDVLGCDTIHNCPEVTLAS